MTPEQIAHMINPPVERCVQCGEEIKGEPFDYVPYDDPICSQSCKSDYDQCQLERASEHMDQVAYGNGDR